jgi:hypothetical protein
MPPVDPVIGGGTTTPHLFKIASELALLTPICQVPEAPAATWLLATKLANLDNLWYWEEQQSMHCSVQQEEEEDDWQGFLHLRSLEQETTELVFNDLVIVYVYIVYI